MSATEKTTLHILTGFLGSGKTTLLNRLLGENAFRDTAVVVNELGEIGLDHLLVAERSGDVALLEGGCLCCAVVDSLPETLLDLCRRRAGGDLPPFGRIVIETTGLADPGPIVEAVRRSTLLSHFLGLGLVITALDMLGGEKMLDRHPEALRQLVLADRVILTKLDLRGPLEPAERARIIAANPFAEILEANDVLAEPARLLAPLPATTRDRAPIGEAGHAHHSHGVAAFGFPIPEPVTHAGLAAFAVAAEHRFGAALLRCKGMVRVGSRRVLVQGVGTRFAFEPATTLPSDAAPHLTCIVQDRARDEIAALLPWLHVPEGTCPPHPEELS